MEQTPNFIQLSVLIFIPILFGIAAFVATTYPRLIFLVFPPLVSGTYTLFADPKGRYAQPSQFVSGLTIGGVCGWGSIEFASWIALPFVEVEIEVFGAMLAILLTGISTWVLGMEEPAAYSTAILIFLTKRTPLTYIVVIAVFSVFIAGAFVLWRDYFYDQRARYIYRSTNGDDHILVPMRGGRARETALFAARLAAAHDVSKIILLKSVVERNSNETIDQQSSQTQTEGHQEAEQLEEFAAQIENETGVPCRTTVVVEDQPLAQLVTTVAHDMNCDLIVTPYETANGSLSSFIQGLFKNEIDVVVYRAVDEGKSWHRLLLLINEPGDLAHSMLDFAQRLTADSGFVSVTKCVSSSSQRRKAERMLESLVEAFDTIHETRVATTSIDQYLNQNGKHYDLILVGASTDRSPASRVLTPPTFEKIQNVDTDVAIVHEGLT